MNLSGSDQLAVDMLARYFLWAEAMRDFHDETWRALLGEPNIKELRTSSVEKKSAAAALALRRDPHRLLGAIGYSLASLYVVVEGYKSLQLVDPDLDRLLASPHVDLLRRYRNGVFHYQPSLLDSRFEDVLDAGDDLVSWLHSLRGAFKSYLTKHAPREMNRKPRAG